MVEKSARTVEEAVQLALKELNKSREEVEINVLSEGSRGFLESGQKRPESE